MSGPDCPPAGGDADIARALDLLRARVAGSSIAAAAADLGYSRPAISALLAGRYPASPAGIVARVLAVWGGIDCPHLRRAIAPADCRQHAGRTMPTGNPRALRHWSACQRCDRHPDALAAGVGAPPTGTAPARPQAPPDTDTPDTAPRGNAP